MPDILLEHYVNSIKIIKLSNSIKEKIIVIIKKCTLIHKNIYRRIQPKTTSYFLHTTKSILGRNIAIRWHVLFKRLWLLELNWLKTMTWSLHSKIVLGKH